MPWVLFLFFFHFTIRPLSSLLKLKMWSNKIVILVYIWKQVTSITHNLYCWQLSCIWYQNAHAFIHTENLKSKEIFTDTKSPLMCLISVITSWRKAVSFPGRFSYNFGSVWDDLQINNSKAVNHFKKYSLLKSSIQ